MHNSIMQTYMKEEMLAKKEYIRLDYFPSIIFWTFSFNT